MAILPNDICASHADSVIQNLDDNIRRIQFRILWKSPIQLTIFEQKTWQYYTRYDTERLYVSQRKMV